MLPALEDALQALCNAGEQWHQAHAPPGQDASSAELRAYQDVIEAQAEQEAAAEESLRRRYAEAFAVYAERFTAAVLDAATALAGLTVPVEVRAEVDPAAPWWDVERGTPSTRRSGTRTTSSRDDCGQQLNSGAACPHSTRPPPQE